jgi:hypothetical protein
MAVSRHERMGPPGVAQEGRGWGGGSGLKSGVIPSLWAAACLLIKEYT